MEFDLETNFYHLDDLRRDFDKRYTSNRGSEQLRDVIMEEYMKKKRMRKASRNDRDEHEEFEKDFIEISEGGSGLKKYLFLAALVALVAYCYVGGGQRRSSGSAIDEITPVAGGKKKSGKASHQTKNSTADDDADKAGITRKRQEEEQEAILRSAQEGQNRDGDDKQQGNKKKGKKK